MTKISENVDDKDLADHIKESLSSIAITTQPVVIVGVQRKANIGNYENIDIYAALALPVIIHQDFDQDELTQALKDATDYAFGLVSQATAERYNSVVKKRRIMLQPCDWDQESYCTAEGCRSPATHRKLTAMAYGDPVYELVCCGHAMEDTYDYILN